jgi:hypothetical protein
LLFAADFVSSPHPEDPLDVEPAGKPSVEGPSPREQWGKNLRFAETEISIIELYNIVLYVMDTRG